MASPQGFGCWTWIAASTVDALAQEAAAAKRALEPEDPELAKIQQKRKAQDLEKEEEKGEEKRDKMEDDWKAWGKWQDEQRWKPAGARAKLVARMGESASAPALGCAKWPRCWTEAVALRGLMQHASIKSTCKQTCNMHTTSYHTHTHTYTVASRIGPGRWRKCPGAQPFHLKGGGKP